MYQPTAYLLRHAQRMPTQPYRRLEQILPADRRKRMLCYRREEDRKNCVFAYCLLQYALKRQFGIRGMPEMQLADSGKPYFSDKAMPRFNWSHCHGGILCAVAMQEVGCDIQDDILHAQALYSRCLHERERKSLPQEEADAAFTRLWALKESYLKYLGVGLRRDMRELDYSDCAQLCGSRDIGDAVLTWGRCPGLYYSVCAQAPADICEINSEMLYQTLCCE